MQVIEILKEMLGVQLQIESRMDDFTADTQLLGSVPEFDSMAVVVLLTTIEEEFGCTMDDDELDAEIFQTLGSLARFVESKL